MRGIAEPAMQGKTDRETRGRDFRQRLPISSFRQWGDLLSHVPISWGLRPEIRATSRHRAEFFVVWRTGTGAYHAERDGDIRRTTAWERIAPAVTSVPSLWRKGFR